MEYGAVVKVALGGSAYEVTSWGFWSWENLSGYRISQIEIHTL